MLEPRGPLVCTYPLFHMAAWTLSLQQWQARAPVVYLDRVDGASIVDAVIGHGAERINAVPAVWQRILDHLGPSGTLPGLRFADTGTSITPPALLEAIARAAPRATVRVFYGSTEAGNVASLIGDEVFTHPYSCGTPSTGTEVRLDELELCVRGPLLFDGYFDDADATAAVLRDGWFHTGDLATVDADGFLTIIGRAGEVIRTGGESVAPGEVESVLAELPSIADVAVVGVPDDTWGEVVCAVVVPAESGDPPTLAELREHCADRLAAFKHPRRIELREALPRTAATGQVQRSSLARALAQASAGVPA
jgi:acyl-CoA synthetase (AMP-forming)/AMP-acid ligase II